MCGIFASIGGHQHFTHRQLNTLKRRGPDAVGFWSNGTVNMAHTRLTIIGLDDRGIQPLENETHVLAYNGELYNFARIRERVAAAGVNTHGFNDAETLLWGWSLWGTSILKDLEGFWSFVVFDKRRQKLILVRDQFGVKPLYYRCTKQSILVSSLLKLIIENMPDAPELDYTALSEYVRYQYTFGDKTFVRDLKKVLPGHYVEIDTKTRAVRDVCYEDIFTFSQRRMSRAWLRSTRQHIIDSILHSTISDTSFTTCCSGGLDSSLITRIAQPEIAYHCNFSDPDCNETFYAQQVLQNTPMRLFVVNAQEEFNLVERLNSLLEDFDELSIGSVILPLDDLFTQVKRRYKVILNGVGGDELFGGYTRYQLCVGHCFQDSYRSLYAKLQQYTSVADRFECTQAKGDVSLYAFYDPSVVGTFRQCYDTLSERGGDMHAMLTFDSKYFLPGLLNIDDKIAGRHSLESRPSLLNQTLVRHLRSIHPNSLLKNRELKWVLKECAKGIVPDSIIFRKDKMGFTTPIGNFINNSAHHIREQITNSSFKHLYNFKKINFTAETKYSREIFGLIILDLWLNRYMKAQQKHGT